MFRRRAFTLIEVLLAGALLSLLMLMHLNIFQSGMSSWLKVEAQGSMLQQIQVAGARWSRECLQSSGTSLEVGPESMALLSPVGKTMPAGSDPLSGMVIWRRSEVFYRDAASREFRLRNLEWPTASSTGQFIDKIDFGSGLKPLSFYCNGGSVLARDIDAAEYSRQANCWQLLLRASQKRYGREDREQVELRFLAIPRNL